MKRTKIILIHFFLFFIFTCPAFAQKYGIPKDGDGIGTFLQRYGLNTASNRAEFRRINKRKFTANGGLILGTKYLLPGKSSSQNTKKGKKKNKNQKGNSIHEPLFGKSYELVKIRNRKLEGACFYLVSGHGGPDPGAIGKIGNHELHEDEYAYDITLRLARNLMQMGAKVHIIIQDEKDGIRNDRYLSNSKRETCMGAAIPLGQVARLQQRSEQINRLYRRDKEKYKRAIFIHVDSRGKRNQVDVFCYYATGSRLGKRLARNIQHTLEKKYHIHQPSRGFDGTSSNRNLYVLRNTTPVAAFLELGNIQNANDQKRLIIPGNRQALADWIAQGILQDYKNR